MNSLAQSSPSWSQVIIIWLKLHVIPTFLSSIIVSYFTVIKLKLSVRLGKCSHIGSMYSLFIKLLAMALHS